MDAFFAFEDGHFIGAQGDGLTGAHGDAGVLFAGDAEVQVAEDDVIGKARHGLDLAAHQQSVLMRNKKAAIEFDLRPSARGEQGVVQGTAIGQG